jgi:hypothetical protein
MSGTGCVQEVLPANARWSYEGYAICNDGYVGVYERRPTTDGKQAPGTPYTSFAFLLKCVTPDEYERLQREGGEAQKGLIFVKGGLGRWVLKPGTAPSKSGTAAAAATGGMAATFLAGLGVAVPQSPRERLRRLTEKEKRKLGERLLREAGVSDDVIARVQDPYGLVWRIAHGLDPKTLGRTLELELRSNPDLARQVLIRAGLNPAQIGLLGGPDRVVRHIGRFVRNPGRAMRDFWRDVRDNVRHPGRFVGRIAQAVANTNPVTGPVVRFIRNAFRGRRRRR